MLRQGTDVEIFTLKSFNQNQGFKSGYKIIVIAI